MSSIITLDDLQTYSGDADVGADLGQLVVDAINAYIENTTGRFWGASAPTVTEVHDYASVIFLRHQDVIEVTEVKRGRGTGSQTTLSTDSYFVNPLGRLVLDEGINDFARVRDYITVTYEYGVTVVPADLQLAALALASDFYTYAEEGNTEVTEAQVGSFRLKGGKSQGSDTGKISYGIINRYRTRRV